MDIRDREKLARLETVIKRNFKITQLYTLYLERCPEIIEKGLIDELTADGRITKKDAIVALLAEIFGLDAEKSAEDRILIRDYLTESVHVLDTGEYTSDAYYLNVAPREAKIDDWEIKWEYYPPYRGAICGDMIRREDLSEVPPLGFFTDGFRFPAVLEGGNEWMTLTPVDTDTVKDAIKDAHGKVVTFGLGLGYYTYHVSEKDSVDSITVVEKSEKVIKLFKEYILPNFSHGYKVNIVHADAFEYARDVMPSEKFDYSFVDTWRDASDGLPMYERMKELEPLSPGTKFSYWIENFILSRKASLRYAELCEKIDSNATDAPKTFDEFKRRLFH